jgi:hypothetical protein
MIIKEAASTVSDAVGDGLALYDSDPGNISASIILYDPLLARSRPTAECITAYVGVDNDPYIAGRFGMVTSSAAESGYGPLTYDYTLSRGYKIISDRSSVSSSAQRVWVYYYLKRSDVMKQRIIAPDTKPMIKAWTYPSYKIEDDDTRDALNHAYWIPNGEERFADLLDAHDACLNRIKGQAAKRQFLQSLRSAALSFFHSNYKDE